MKEKVEQVNSTEELNRKLNSILIELKTDIKPARRRTLEREFRSIVLGWDGAGYRICFQITFREDDEDSQYYIQDWEAELLEFDRKVKAFHGEENCQKYLINGIGLKPGSNNLIVMLPCNNAPADFADTSHGSELRAAYDSGTIREFVAFEDRGQVTIFPDGYNGMASKAIGGHLTVPYTDRPGTTVTIEMQKFELV